MFTMTPQIPTFTDQYTNARVECTARRRRLLEGSWGEDLELFLQTQIPIDRRGTWGSLDMSSNIFKSGCKALSVLYSTTPSVGVERQKAEAARPYIGPHGVLDNSHYFEMMSTIQMFTIGLREMLVRIDISDDNAVMFRPVTPDMVFASAPAGNPTKANYLYEYRLRRNDSTGEEFWTADIFDLRDKNNPRFEVRKVEADGKFSDDVTNIFLGGDRSGNNYPYRDGQGVPFIPWVFYHAAITGKLFSPYELSEVVQGSFVASTYYTYLKHLMFDASYPQRYTTMQLAGLSAVDIGTKAARLSVPTDPASILCFAPDPDISSQPIIGQFAAGMDDPLSMISAITTYERRLAAQMGIDPASVQKVSSDPRSGYSIAMSMDAMRSAQKKYEPTQRVADIEAISMGAMVSNAILGTSYPTDGYVISYESIPLTKGERKAQIENTLALMAKGLLGPVDAMMDLYPEISTEEQAMEKLRQIKQQKIEFA